MTYREYIHEELFGRLVTAKECEEILAICASDTFNEMVWILDTPIQTHPTLKDSIWLAAKDTAIDYLQSKDRNHVALYLLK